MKKEILTIDIGDHVQVIDGNGPRSFFEKGKVFAVGRIAKFNEIKVVFPIETLKSFGYNIDTKKVIRVR